MTDAYDTSTENFSDSEENYRYSKATYVTKVSMVLNFLLTSFKVYSRYYRE
jgi:hypothetical protein